MASQIIYLTAHGKRKYEQDLIRLHHYLQRVARRLRRLRRRNNLEEDGDWEYTMQEYDYATKRIDEIEKVLENCNVLTTHGSGGKVSLGSVVSCRNRRSNHVFTLVDPVEADPEHGKVSVKSPLGKALLGKRANDEITIQAPAGSIYYTITKVS